MGKAHHVVTTLGPGGHHGNVLGGVFGVHVGHVTHPSVDNEDRLVICHWKLSTTGAVQLSTPRLLRQTALVSVQALPALPVGGGETVLCQLSILPPKSLAVLRVCGTISVVAVSVSTVTGQSVLSVGVRGARRGRASTVFC